MTATVTLTVYELEALEQASQDADMLTLLLTKLDPGHWVTIAVEQWKEATHA